jgi:hypothetical protein
MDALPVFLFAGTLTLAWQAWADLKDKDLKEPNVFSKRSWFMMGVLVTLVLALKYNFWLYVGIIFGASILLSLPYWKNFLGEGDREALRWIITGLLIIDAPTLAIFALFLGLFSGIVFLARRLYKVNGDLPYFPTMLAAFLMCDAIFWLPSIL